MEMPKPTDAHRVLHKMAGSWSGEEKMSPSPWDPKGGTALARVNNRVALDGFVVIQDYEQERNGTVTFRGHGVFAWDQASQDYVCSWWDSMGMPPNEFRGQVQDDVFTFTSKNAQGHSRSAWDFSQEGRYKFRMDVSQDGKKWYTLIEGTYQRDST